MRSQADVKISPSGASVSLRLGLAAIFLPYGIVKVFTFPARVEHFASLAFPAPGLVAALSLSLEIVAGLLLVTGVNMRLTATLVILDTVAILTPVNWDASPLDWWPQIAVRVAPAVALALLGPGAFSLGRAGRHETLTESA
jgi:uncharacterized membrane protein YphA (DoxX/SURF4 family)